MLKPRRISGTKKRKVLAMRFQALGDTVITLPYLQSLKRKYPDVELHFLTRKEVCEIPAGIDLFDKIITIGGKRNAKLQFLLILLKLPYLLWQRYDVVLDLQKHKISVILRKLLGAKTWAEFDKYSPISAGERTRKTIEATNLWRIDLDTNFRIRAEVDILLTSHGWAKENSLVVLNPAGYCPSRNWPLEYYVSFAKQWLDQIDRQTQFVLLLLPAIQEKASYIKSALGEYCVDLTGRASQVEAFAILQKCSFVLSEDGGLMHMAWVQGIPTLALFSSSRKDWSAPQGTWSACLDSSDMECGPCQLAVCKYGDNRCLIRFEPEFVLSRAKEILKRTKDRIQ